MPWWPSERFPAPAACSLRRLSEELGPGTYGQFRQRLAAVVETLTRNG